jgi:hypothetical protein
MVAVEALCFPLHGIDLDVMYAKRGTLLSFSVEGCVSIRIVDKTPEIIEIDRERLNIKANRYFVWHQPPNS